MALIVENGTQVANANSYVDIAFADAYHAAMGNDAWADLDSGEKEIALRRGIATMTQFFRPRWKGARMKWDQPLDWPRYDVKIDDYYWYWPSGRIPVEVQNAQCEFALRSLSVTLIPDQDQNIISESVAGITTVYDRTSPQQRQYVSIELMLSPYLKSAGVPLVR